MEDTLPQIELLSQSHQGTLASFPFSESVDTGVFVNATTTIAGIELQTIDVALVVLCPIFAAIGILIASLLSTGVAQKEQGAFKRFFAGIFSNIGNLFIGLVVGLVTALFFVGAINNDLSSLARVLVLTLFLGYKAPLFWLIKKRPQEKAPASSHKSSKAVSMPAERTQQDALAQERLKRERMKLAAKS